MIAGRLHAADVLIHIEPADRVRPGTEIATREGEAPAGPPPADDAAPASQAGPVQPGTSRGA